jgi:hypothetical protein
MQNPRIGKYAPDENRIIEIKKYLPAASSWGERRRSDSKIIPFEDRRICIRIS